MSEIWYLASILFTFTAYAVAVWAAWQVVEGVYWLYCKVTKKEY